MRSKLAGANSRMTGLGSISLYILIGGLLTGCASHYCRETLRRQDGTKNQRQTQLKDQELSSSVKVYKYDGSLQCGLGDAIDVKSMAAELSGIVIIGQEKRHDGLLHITVCGSTTGYANVYEVSKDDLEQAQKRGFKIWKER